MIPWHRCGLHLAQTNEVWLETVAAQCHTAPWSPCPIGASPSTMLTEGQGSFQNSVSPSPSWGSSQCQPPQHPKPCHLHSCARDLSVVDLWGSSCPYLAECHYWQWSQPCQWACCRWRDSSCSQWTACCAPGNPQASSGHHQGGEGQSGPKIWRNKEMLIISCKEFVFFCSFSYCFQSTFKLHFPLLHEDFQSL